MFDKSIGIIPVTQDDSGEIVCLVVQHANGGHFGVPKGHPKKGESEEETAKRELFEETGLLLKEFLQKPVFTTNYSFEKGGIKINKEVKYYLGLIDKDNPSTPLQFQKEILQAVWMSFDKLIDLVEYADAKILIKSIRQYVDEHKEELFP